jgi:hypothetical protein
MSRPVVVVPRPVPAAPVAVTKAPPPLLKSTHLAAQTGSARAHAFHPGRPARPPARPKYDLQASLKRPLTYRPHVGSWGGGRVCARRAVADPAADCAVQGR